MSTPDASRAGQFVAQFPEALARQWLTRGALTRQSVVLAARLINRYSVCACVLCLHGAVYWLRWPAGASLRDTAGRLCQLVAQALRGYNAITF